MSLKGQRIRELEGNKYFSFTWQNKAQFFSHLALPTVLDSGQQGRQEIRGKPTSLTVRTVSNIARTSLVYLTLIPLPLLLPG